MADRTEQSQSFHDSMIKQLAEQLIGRKFRDVRADHPDFVNKPARITVGTSPGGQVPDITATGIQMVLFEVETEETICDDHSEKQWEAFSTYAEGHLADFWIVVPKATQGTARERVSSLGLKAKVMGI